MRESTADDVQRLVEAITQLFHTSVQRLMGQIPTSIRGSTSPYRALGLDPSAPDDLVRLAYKWLAQRCHPDHGGDAQAMAKLNQAYQQIVKERGWKP